jgi:hypothetical protein
VLKALLESAIEISERAVFYIRLPIKYQQFESLIFDEMRKVTRFKELANTQDCEVNLRFE